MLIPNPYFRDAQGKSITREALIRLFSSLGGPVDLPDGSVLPASAVMEPSVPNPLALYENPAKDIALSYCGRASKLLSSKNPSEETWCVMADVSKACETLTRTQREVLAFRYIYDYTERSIASVLNLTLVEIADAERTAFDKLIAILDDTDDQ